MLDIKIMKNTAQKIIIWETEKGEYPEMSLSGLQDFCEGRET